MMELEQLRVFAAVADEGSFTGAARRLYISHSTVSRAVSTLERELGVTLVVRHNRVEELTPAGEVLLEEAERLLAAERAAGERVRAAGMTPGNKKEVEIN